MLLPRTRAASTLVVLAETGSTNDELRMLGPDAAEFTAVLTTNQTNGRGRLDRRWVAAPGDGVAISVLLRPSDAVPSLPIESWGWIPLLAGLAMAGSVADAMSGTEPGGAEAGGDASVGLKWPNDVHVRGRKVCGILSELLPDGAIVLGAGVNLETPEERLPTGTATSLLIEGAGARGDALVDLVAGGFLERFRGLYARLVEAGGDAVRSGLHDDVERACTTVGRRVRVQVPGVPDRLATATGIDSHGRLLVQGDADREIVAVAAGDVTHLRYE